MTLRILVNVLLKLNCSVAYQAIDYVFQPDSFVSTNPVLLSDPFDLSSSLTFDAIFKSSDILLDPADLMMHRRTVSPSNSFQSPKAWRSNSSFGDFKDPASNSVEKFLRSFPLCAFGPDTSFFELTESEFEAHEFNLISSNTEQKVTGIVV